MAGPVTRVTCPGELLATERALGNLIVIGEIKYCTPRYQIHHPQRGFLNKNIHEILIVEIGTPLKCVLKVNPARILFPQDCVVTPFSHCCATAFADNGL